MLNELGLDSGFYSIAEFATKLRVHPNTIRRAIRSHKITALRLGTKKKPVYRIPYSEIDRILVIDLEAYIDKLVDEKIAKIHSPSAVSP